MAEAILSRERASLTGPLLSCFGKLAGSSEPEQTRRIWVVSRSFPLQTGVGRANVQLDLSLRDRVGLDTVYQAPPVGGAGAPSTLGSLLDRCDHLNGVFSTDNRV